MNKNLIIGLVVVIVIALGAWYVLSQGSGTATPTGAPTTSTTTTSSAATSGAVADETTPPVGKGSGSLQSVLSRGGNYTCTFTTISTAAGSGSKSSGTIYVSAGKTRGDFSATTNTGATTMVHIIRSGSTSYTWVAGQPTGSKAAITPTSPTITNPSGGSITQDQFANVSWDCHAWLPDVTQFVPPPSIKFVQS